MGASHQDSPGVRLYPPLYLLAGLLAGWAVGRLAPLEWLDPTTARNIGAPPTVAGILVEVWIFSTFLRAGSDPRPDRPSKVLFTGGLFRYSRNPMYAGGIVFYAGVAVWTQWWWAFAFLPAVMYGLTRRVILREEAYMERTFGEPYREYRRQVPRWL
jgi:protein-S-isoprenylcysteine O-methyltransferase Ste14